MRGWVYIITNKAMPGLLKVGFSLKDPHLRAKELGHTGSPHPYLVEFDMLVNEPRNIEQRIHKALKNRQEGKEWFRCAIQEALGVIHDIVGTDVLLQGTGGPRVSEIGTRAPDGDKATPDQKIVRQRTLRRTATYAGRCAHCGDEFTVTLTRYDSGARCPHCFRMNDTSLFQRSEFVI